MSDVLTKVQLHNFYKESLAHGYKGGLCQKIHDEKGNSTISVADYAKAMVDELETPAHHKERFTIGY